jgi:hypothetical protein
MGGDSKGGGPSNSTLQTDEGNNITALTNIAQQAQGQSNQLFGAAFPGFQAAENHAATLASGDPSAIARAIAPATQQVTQATAGAKQNILNNAPAGGEKNLALEQADVNQGAQVGALASQGFNNSFNTLAQLSGQGVSQGQTSSGLAVSGINSANSAISNLFNQHQEQKGSTLGAIGGAAGDATSLATALIYA